MCNERKWKKWIWKWICMFIFIPFEMTQVMVFCVLFLSPDFKFHYYVYNTTKKQDSTMEQKINHIYKTVSLFIKELCLVWILTPLGNLTWPTVNFLQHAVVITAGVLVNFTASHSANQGMRVWTPILLATVICSGVGLWLKLVQSERGSAF